MAVMELPSIKEQTISFTIHGTSPLIQHAWSAKSKKMMRDKHAGVKTKTRDVRNPEQEFKDAMYLTSDKKYAIPAMAIKSAMISAAHKDIGIEKTMVRKALFLHCPTKEMLLEMDCSEPIMREDVVRVGAGSTDLRYRPEFENWSVRVEFTYDGDLLTGKSIMTLVDRAGFGVGLHEMRPEKGGEFGRFRIDREQPVIDSKP